MPVGGGGKPAGGYRAGKKGTYGCKGYPTVSADGTVHGCHPTKQQAQAQARAIWASVNKVWENSVFSDSRSPISSTYTSKKAPCWDGYVMQGMKEQNGRMVPNCVPVQKAAYPISEGDFVVAMAPEVGPIIGQVEHVMSEGGTYGQPGNPMAIESTPENPAMSVRLLEEENGQYFFTPYSVGVLMSEAKKVERPDIVMDDFNGDDMNNGMDDNEDDRRDDNDFDKAISDINFTPTDSMASNARRGLALRDEHNRGGTAVGIARARDIANKKNLSPSTVLRMHSFFSRHAVDKQASGWTQGEEGYPSNGLIAWLLWGGDSGKSWAESKRNAIMRERMKKSIWSDSPFNTKNI